MTEQQTPSTQSATGTSGEAPSHAAVGPLTIRDLWVLVSVAIIFIASLMPVVSTIAGNFNLWNTGGLFYIGIGVVLPLAVGGLFLARRLSPENKVRIGSLSVDQFASVVAAFATYFFFTGTVTNFGFVYLVGLIGSLLLLAGTVCAQWIPMLASDFAGRADVPAHMAARDAIPATKRVATAKPAAVGAGAGAAGTHYGHGAPRQGAQAVPAQGSQAQGSQAQGNQTQGTQGPSGQGQSGAQGAGGWAAAPAAGHASAGQIFTPAKEANPSQGAPAQSGAEQAGAGAAATNSAAAQTVSAAAPGAAAAKTATNTPAATESAAAAQPAAGQGTSPAFAAGKSAGEKTSTETAAMTSQGDAGRPGSDHSGSDHSDGFQSGAAQGTAAATTLNPQVAASAKDSIAATVNPKAAAAPVSVDPFWFAVDRPQNVIDENTRQFLFKLAPGSWILALEDRGNSFLVQDSRGKTGVLLDLVGIERASDSQ